jgi:hypothetical protein
VREHFTVDWAFGITGAIENVVRKTFPQNLRNWPLLGAFDFEAYELPDQYIAFILKDKLAGITAGPGVAKSFPYSDHPTLPPRIEEIELWQFYFRDKFDLREEDAAFLIPIRDSGKNSAPEDFELFSPEERMFWNRQLAHVVSSYNAYLQSLDKPQQPTNVTNYIVGDNPRQYINSIDSSLNLAGAGAAEVFDKLREQLAAIEDETKRKEVSEAIDEMESAHGSNDFLTRYKEFVSLTADHVTVFAPFFPTLANLLG